MSKIKVKLNKAGVRDLLLSEEVSSYIGDLARSKASGLGAGYEANVQPGQNRINARIVAVTEEAVNENFDNNTLVKAVSS